MKSLILSLIVASTAMANSAGGFKKVDVRVTRTMGSLFLFGGMGLPTAGTIKIANNHKSAEVFIATSRHCPPNRLCPAVMPKPISLSFGKVELKNGNCGATHYMAKTTNGEHGASKITYILEVIDNSTNRCMGVVFGDLVFGKLTAVPENMDTIATIQTSGLRFENVAR